MGFSELQQAVADAVAAGRIGTPVSARIVAQLRCSPGELPVGASVLLDWTARVLAASPVRLHVRAGANGKQLHVLATLAGGRTASLVCGVHPAGGSELQLLFVGNHGVLRLEGGDDFDSATLPWDGPAESRVWIEQGLQTGTGVAVGQNVA